jgi:hypothetical protein
MRANVIKLPMNDLGDVSAPETLVVQGSVAADSILAVIGKTEGNGGSTASRAATSRNR